MKVLIIFGLCSVLLASCGDGGNYNRGYVISKSPGRT